MRYLTGDIWATTQAHIVIPVNCKGVAYFFKQFGAWAPYQYASTGIPAMAGHKLPESNGTNYHQTDDGVWLVRTNKHLSGRLLDGREWNEMPL